MVSDQLRALTLMGKHWGSWDVSRTDQAAAAAADLARTQQAADDDEALIVSLMEGEHQLSREAAEDLVADLHEALVAERAKRSMAAELKSALLGGPQFRVSNARKDEIILELCHRHGLIEPDEPEPDPEPRPALPCGFRELPPYEPDPPPLIRPKPAPPIEPEPVPVPVTPAHLDPRCVAMGDMYIVIPDERLEK